MTSLRRISNKSWDYTSKDYEAFRNMMINELSFKMPEYTDKRQSDAGIVIIELLSQGLDILSYYQDVIANETFLVTSEQRNNILKWSKILGYVPKNSTPSRFEQVFKLTTPQSNDTIIPTRTVVKTVSSQAEPEIKFETTTDLIIPSGKLGNEKDVETGDYLYSVEVVQGTSVLSELVGSSDDSPDQWFKLNYSPVIIDSVLILINEGSGFEKWERVDTFIDSTSVSKHYVATINDNNEAIITFGNGIFGKIPNKFTNGIYCDYRIGGGEVGNVGSNKIIVVDSSLAIIDSTFNPNFAIENGTDKENTEDIKINAPTANRTLWGALTLDDFSEVVRMNFPEVVYAISKRDESFIDDIHIYVLLEGNASLTEEYINQILSLFDENEGGRKIVGSNTIYIHDPSFVDVNIICELIVEDYYSRSIVELQIKEYIENFLKVGNFPFYTELSLSGISASVMDPDNAIEGIKAFRITAPSEQILYPKIEEIYRLGTLTINSSGGIT